MPAQSAMLRQGYQVQEDRRQHPQTALRQDARKIEQRQKLHTIFNQEKKQYGRTGLRHAHQLSQYETHQQPGNGAGEQTRFDGRTNLQSEEIPAFCGEKTKCFGSSSIPETRGRTHFSKNAFPEPPKLVCTPPEF